MTLNNKKPEFNNIVDDLMDYFEVLVEHNDYEKIELINEGLKDKNGEIRGKNKIDFIEQANNLLLAHFENPKMVIKKIEEYSKHGLDDRIKKALDTELLNMFTPDSYSEYPDIEVDAQINNEGLIKETEDPKIMLNQFNNNHTNAIKNLIDLQVDKIISLNELEINEDFSQDDLDNIIVSVNSKICLLPDKVVNKIILELDKQIIEKDINKEKFIDKLETIGATSLITQSLKGIDLSKMYELSKMNLSVKLNEDKKDIDNSEAILLDPEYDTLIAIYKFNNEKNGYIAEKYSIDFETSSLTKIGGNLQMEDVSLEEVLKHVKKINPKAIEVSVPIVIVEEKNIGKTKPKKISQNLEFDFS